MAPAALDSKHQLRPVHSDRALTDWRPASLIGSTTIATLEAGLGRSLDRRRFRMNVYAWWSAAEPEEECVGRRIRLGEQVTFFVLERDPRCKMTSPDPDTGAHAPAIFRHVAQQHGACAGGYAAVLVEGVVRQGDPITLWTRRETGVNGAPHHQDYLLTTQRWSTARYGSTEGARQHQL